MSPPKRHQTQTERDLDGYKAKVQREAERAAAGDEEDAVPEAIDFEQATGVVKGQALISARRRRSTSQRLDHADERLDQLVGELVKSREFVRALAWKVLAIIGPIVTYLIGKYT